MTPFQKQVRAKLNDANVTYHNKLVCRKDGSIEVKRSYFYRPSGGATKWAAQISDLLSDIPHVIDSRDDFRQWPTTSYLVAIVKEAGDAT